MTRFKIEITEDIIAHASRRDSSHCMIADAVAAALPAARQIVVDLQSIRWSDPTKGKRYICLTPRPGQEALIMFDDGRLDILPFTLTLTPAQTVPVRRRINPSDDKVRKGRPAEPPTARIVKRDGTVEGGGALPVGPIPGTANQSGRGRLGKRRTFGLRGLRREVIATDSQ